MTTFIITPSKQNSKTAITKALRAQGVKVSRDYTVTPERSRQLEICVDFAQAGQIKQESRAVVLPFDSLSDYRVARTREKNLDSFVQHMAFNTYDFGRKKNIHFGERHSLPRLARLDTRSDYRGGWICYDYYADYYLRIDDRRAEWKLTSGEEGSCRLTRLGSFALNGKKKVYVIDNGCRGNGEIKAHHIRKMLESQIPRFAKIKVQVFGTTRVRLTDSTGEHYHFDVSRRDCNFATLRQRINQAIKAFRRRRRESKALRAQGLDRVFVDFEDSLKAGNCETETKYFASQMWRTIGAVGACAVRADLILAARNDNYTRRAVSIAVQHNQFAL